MTFFPLLYSLGVSDIEGFDSELFNFASILSTTALISFLLGGLSYYLLPLQIKPETKNSTKEKNLLFGKVNNSLIIFTSFWVLVLTYLVLGFTYVHIPSIFLLIFLFFYIYGTGKSNINGFKMLIGLSLILFVSTYITSGRRDLLKVMFIFLAFLPFTNIKVSLTKIFSVFTIVAISLIIITLHRSTPLVDFTDLITRISKQLQEAELLLDFLLVNADFAVAYDNYLFIIDNIRELGMLYGSSLIKMFIFFIPRVIWPSKPIDVQLLIVEENINFTFAGGTSQSMNLIGEVFWNFGTLGIPLIFFLLGILFKVIDKNILSSSRFYKSLYIVFSPTIFLIWRGAVSTTVVDSLIVLIVCILIFFISLITFNLFPKSTNLQELNKLNNS